MPTTLHAFFEVFDSPAPQTSHTPFLFGRYMGWLVPQLNPSQLTPANRHLLDSAFALGITEMERERKRDPRNELIYLQQSRLALLASQSYGLPVYYGYAVKALREAVRLSPRRVQPKLVLGYTLMMGKQFDEAKIQLDAARAIYPTSGQIYYYIGELHRLQADPVGAGAALDTSLTLGYFGPSEVYFATMGALQKAGKYEEAARLGEAYLTAAQPGYKPDGTTKKINPASIGIVPVMARLPWLWAKAGNKTRALAAVRNFRAAYFTGAASADRFEKELASGKASEWERDTSLLDLPKN
jgi:tetratricopeptide (TPR) repeat protein